MNNYMLFINNNLLGKNPKGLHSNMRGQVFTLYGSTFI